MPDFTKLVDKRWLAIGKSLPFSIYDGHRKLLLAQGHVVESERSLARLVDQGQYYRVEPQGASGESADEAAGADPVDPLTALSCEYANVAQRTQCGVKIAPKETGEGYLCWVIGVSQENRCLVMTAPVRSDNSLAPISKGQVWFCRMAAAKGVHRFRGAIVKVAFEPYPYLHILVPQPIEQRLVNRLPRALVSLAATLDPPQTRPATIVDLSVGAARIAVEKGAALGVGSSIQLAFNIDSLGQRQELHLPCKVSEAHGVADSRHPGISFYGLTFGALDERVQLSLHGFVQEQLAAEYDALGQALALGFGTRI